MHAGDEALSRLVTQINAWHDAAGRPTAQEIAKATGNSHTTVASMLSGRRVPRWHRLERVVRYIGGDTAAAHALWLEHVRAEDAMAAAGGADERRERASAALREAKSVLDEVIGLPMTGPERDYESRSMLRAAVLPVLVREFLGKS